MIATLVLLMVAVAYVVAIPLGLLFWLLIGPVPAW